MDGDERNTTLIFRTLRNTERVYKNDNSLKVREIKGEKPGDFAAVRPYVRGDAYKKSFQETGNTQDSWWSCGQVMGLIDDIPSCAELCDRIVAEAEEIVGNMGSFVAAPAPAASKL